jgi:hypothetical protein
MGHLAQPGMTAGAVDDDEIAHRLQRCHPSRQARIKGVFALLQRLRRQIGQVGVMRARQFQSRALQIGDTVLHIAAKAFLAQIQIQPTHPKPHADQRGGDMHRGGRLARSALFVSNNDDMRHRRHPQTQTPHGAPSNPRTPRLAKEVCQRKRTKIKPAQAPPPKRWPQTKRGAQRRPPIFAAVRLRSPDRRICS